MSLLSVIHFEQFYQPAGLMKIILFLVEFGDKNAGGNQLLILLSKKIMASICIQNSSSAMNSSFLLQYSIFD